MANWYRMSIKPGQAVVWIEGVIGWDQTVDQFRDDLAKVSAMPEIRVRINSPGGDIGDGMVIYNLIADYRGKVVTEVMGLAASMASIIAMAGDRRIMRSGTRLMIHNPWTISMGDADALRHEADVLDSYRESLVSVYAAASGMDRAAVVAMMDAETWLSPEEALAQGFATEIDAEQVARAASADRPEFAAMVARYNQFAQESPMSHNTAAPDPVVAPVAEPAPAVASAEPVAAEPAATAVEPDPVPPPVAEPVAMTTEQAIAHGMQLERERVASIRTRAAQFGASVVDELIGAGCSVAEADSRIVDMILQGRVALSQPAVEPAAAPAADPFAGSLLALPQSSGEKSLLEQYNEKQGRDRNSFYNKHKAAIIAQMNAR